jgi:hypothetical protein
MRFASVAGAALVSVAMTVGMAPPATATMYLGNYSVHIPDRRDFHTWIWSALTLCPDGQGGNVPDCINILFIPQPVAKAAYSRGNAHLADGRYIMTIDDPFGLRCGDIYYGPTIPTHDVYSWDATTLAGEMVSNFAAGCDGAPGGSLTYPFHLTRM